MDAAIANANTKLDSILAPLFANTTFLAVLGLFFALYAGFLAPSLPNGVIMFFDTIPGKLLFIFLIAFVASRNVENSLQVALIVSVIFLVSLVVLNNLKMKEAFRTIGVEHFSLMNQMRGIVEHMNEQPAAPSMPALDGAPQQKPLDSAAPAPEPRVDNEPKPSNEDKCNNVLSWCAINGDKEVRGKLWSEQGLDGAEPQMIPEDNFNKDNCAGYFATCRKDNANYSFKPALNAQMCKPLMNKENCGDFVTADSCKEKYPCPTCPNK